MANEMRTYVTVVSDMSQVSFKLQEIFKFEKMEGKHETNSLDIINNIKKTKFSYQNETAKENWNKDVDFPSNDLWGELIGPKWLYAEYVHNEKPKLCNIVIRTAYNLPIPFLQTLHSILSQIDKNIIIRGIYEDENYSTCGAFVYGDTSYDKIEDFHKKYDWNKAIEDDFYEENWHDMLYRFEQDLVNIYLETKDENN